MECAWATFGPAVSKSSLSLQNSFEMCPVSLVRVGESFRQAGLQCIAVRVCGAMCQTLAIYMDCFVACVCVCATLECTTYACWQRTRATPRKFHWLGAYGASKGVLNNARATRSQRSSPRPELPCSPTWANVIAMATIASNSGKKNKHKTSVGP